MSDELSPDSSAELLSRWRQGDQQAASQLWQRYAVRLIALARSRLSQQVSSQLDPEDVVQSVYRRFFSHAKDEHYVLKQSGDLWKLLVAITLHRVQDQHRRHRARKRALGEAHPLHDTEKAAGIDAGILAADPAPEQAAMVADELKQVLLGLDTEQREMVALRLEGYELEEIARQMQRNERTVRRVLKAVRERLQKRCQEYTKE